MIDIEKDYQKKELLEQVSAFRRLAVVGVPILLALLVFARLVFNINFSNWVFAIAIYFFFSIFLLSKLQTKITLIATIVFSMIISAFLLYFFMPFIINYFGGVVLLAFVFNIFFIGNIFNVSLGRSFIYIFLAISSVTSSILIFLEYYGIYPRPASYIVNDYYLKDKAHLIFSFTVFIISIIYFTFHVDSLLNILRNKIEELGRTRLELLETRLGLEKRVEERTGELEEAKNVLEIKVQARTRELARSAESLEAGVKERTKELEKKIDELEKFNKLAIGRELRLKELEEKM